VQKNLKPDFDFLFTWIKLTDSSDDFITNIEDGMKQD